MHVFELYLFSFCEERKINQYEEVDNNKNTSLLKQLLMWCGNCNSLLRKHRRFYLHIHQMIPFHALIKAVALFVAAFNCGMFLGKQLDERSSNVPFNGIEKRCIGFSLYPENNSLLLKYSQGFIQQIKLAKILYPNWKIKLYISSKLKNDHFYQEFSHSNDIDIIWKDESGTDHYGHFWRFLVADDVQCDRWIVRDVDCRFTIREMQAVHEWINSGKSFHIMRDHELHDGEILAGLFGGTSRSLNGKKMLELIQEYLTKHENKDSIEFWSDQTFLKLHVFPLIKNDFIAHDDFSNHGSCKLYGNCVRFPVDDLPFVSHWREYETVDCSCRPRCICGENKKCPTEKVARLYHPICEDNF